MAAMCGQTVEGLDDYSKESSCVLHEESMQSLGRSRFVLEEHSCGYLVRGDGGWAEMNQK